MSSPMIEQVRDIPLIVQKDYPMEIENTGFPFDDDTEDRQDAPFRSQLDDIAARHPEFAQHLGSFPFRSGTRARSQIPEHFTRQRFADSPFSDRFESFGFPFDESPKEEEKPYYQRYPEYYPTHSSEESGQEVPSTNSNVDQENCEQPEENTRSRRPNKNIQQSNTVDLGQKQEPVDDRNQRSMSAPPPNNRPRFVSSINIPVNQPPDHHSNDNQQASAPSQPQERVIPIHVEGRDEPVIPRKTATHSTSQPHPQQSQPHNDKFFTQRSPNFSQYFNRDQPFQNEWFPRTFHAKQPQTQSTFNQGQRGRSPQPQTKPEPQQQSTNVPKTSDDHQKSTEQVKTETPQAEIPKPQVATKPDPIDQIKSIQKDVSELMTQVDHFTGKPRDKQYLYLDEMLTRNLIKLDNIDTQGQENIRLARKEAIKCIEKCISILESKANANVGKVSEGEDKTMEVENIGNETKEAEIKESVEESPEVCMKKEVPSEELNKVESKNDDNSMEVDKPVEKIEDSTTNRVDVVEQQHMDTESAAVESTQDINVAKTEEEQSKNAEQNDNNVQESEKETTVNKTSEVKSNEDKEEEKNKSKKK